MGTHWSLKQPYYPFSVFHALLCWHPPKTQPTEYLLCICNKGFDSTQFPHSFPSQLCNYNALQQNLHSSLQCMPSSLFFTIHTPPETVVHYLYTTVPAQCGSHTNSSIISPTLTYRRSVVRRSKHGRAHIRSGKASQETTRFTLFHGQNLNILISCLFPFRSYLPIKRSNSHQPKDKRIQFLPIRATYCHGDR